MHRLNGWQRAWVVTALVWAALLLATIEPHVSADDVLHLVAVWAFPLIVIYLLGVGIAWVRAGFKQNRSERERSTNAATPASPPPASPSPPPPPTARQPANKGSRRSTTGQHKWPFIVLALLVLVVWAVLVLLPSGLIKTIVFGGFLFFVPPFALGMAIARRTLAWGVTGSIATIVWIILLLQPSLPGEVRAIACFIAFLVIAIVNAFIRRTRGWKITAIAVIFVPISWSVVVVVVAVNKLGFRARIDHKEHQQQQTTLQVARSGDITFSLRQRASGIVDPLVQSGISGDEARRIAIFEMPSTLNIDRWRNDLLPRLNPEQKEVVTNALKAYHELRHPATDSFIGVILSEQAICHMLYADTPMTMGEIFDVWRTGLCNQTEDWWESQLRGLPTAQQEELKRLRKGLKDDEAKGASEQATRY